MSSYTDQLGNTIELLSPPKRIVSLVPSQTELLHDLGLDAETAGITKFCIHPEAWFRTKTRVGGTKTVDIDGVRQLQPDLIIANKEENVKEQIEALQQIAPVWVSDINNLPDATDMINSIGAITGKKQEANRIIDHINTGFQELTGLMHQPPINERPRAAYLIWKDPYMTIGGDTFIHDMMQYCGLHNVFVHECRYPEISVEQLKKRECQVLLLSSEPYPFREKHIHELQAALPATKIVLADGEMFSWYGSRLMKAPAYFRQLRSALFTG